MARTNNRSGRKSNNNRRRKGGNGRVAKRRFQTAGVTRKQVFQTNGNGLSNRGAIRRPNINQKFFERGSDFLGPLTVKAGVNIFSAADRILLANNISPSAYPGTRLTQLAPLWERYRFRRFRLRWVPAVPKTIACQLIVYQDTDPLDDPSTITNAESLVRQATAQTGSQQFNFINPMSVELAQRADDQLYYTGNDKQNERFSRQGNFYVVQVTDPLDLNGVALTGDIMAGSLYVDWECEFQIAQINPSAAAVLPFHTSQKIPFTAAAQIAVYSGPPGKAIAGEFVSRHDVSDYQATLTDASDAFHSDIVSATLGVGWSTQVFDVEPGSVVNIPARTSGSHFSLVTFALGPGKPFWTVL
mgnify:CR=1 FL=1